MSTTDKSATAATSPSQIQAALNSVVTSEAFRASHRLKAFLTYVIEEGLSGNADQIRAKRILVDVYERSAGPDADEENLVRVDAGRLRRRLEQYYLGEGKEDPLRIHLDPGGYTPRFEEQMPSGHTPRSSGRHMHSLWIAGCIVFGLIAASAIAYLFVNGTSEFVFARKDGALPASVEIADDKREAERLAILQNSQASLQAVNLAEQSRGLIFPMFDLERVRLAADMFRQVIRLDDQYFGGYAGAAQTLGTLAFLSPQGPAREKFQTSAQQMIDRALAIKPASSWTQSSAAWVAFSGKDFDRAMKLSELALKISPQDGNVLDFHGVISLFTGHFESARDAADPSRARVGPGHRFANRNIYGAANFHLGNYALTISSLQAAAVRGDPVSAPSYAFQAAAYHAMGNFKKASEMAKLLSDTWPDYRPDLILRRIYQRPEHAEAVVSRLLAAGWSPPIRPATSIRP